VSRWESGVASRSSTDSRRRLQPHQPSHPARTLGLFLPGLAPESVLWQPPLTMSVEGMVFDAIQRLPDDVTIEDIRRKIESKRSKSNESDTDQGTGTVRP